MPGLAPLTLAVAQPACVAYDVAANVRTYAKSVRAARARVVVFPELSLTGYELDAPALTPEDPRLRALIEACAETAAVALVGAPVRARSGPRHLSMLAIDGAGATIVYDKRFLGGSEREWFEPGERPATLTIDGWRLGLAICKDTGVTQHAVDLAALGMDIYVAGIVHAEDELGIHDERARKIARDHHVWVAIASCAGPMGGGYDRTVGRSGIWSPAGQVVAQVGPELEAIATATLS